MPHDTFVFTMMIDKCAYTWLTRGMFILTEMNNALTNIYYHMVVYCDWFYDWYWLCGWL